MKQVVLATSMAFLVGTATPPLHAQPRIHLNIPLPPPIVFPAPPSVVILPETRVYAVPDVREDLFFYAGWWWRPWNGRWYRSHHHDRGWAHYGGVPSWYRGIPRGWRDDYHAHRWGGGAWNHRPIPHHELQQNWRGWHESRHWDQPQHRQHEARRDGRPFASAPDPGRRVESGRPGPSHRGPESGRMETRHPRPIEKDTHGRSGRERGRLERDSPPRGHSGGPEHRDPKRERH